MISLGYLIRFGKWVLLNSCLGIVRIKLRLEGKALNLLVALDIKSLYIFFWNIVRYQACLLSDQL